MGYFSNGTEGMMYEEQYCLRCLNYREGACAIWMAHTLHNYKECNNEDSILHLLIPRGQNGENKKCTMFLNGAIEIQSVADAKKYLQAFGFKVEKKVTATAAT